MPVREDRRRHLLALLLAAAAVLSLVALFAGCGSVSSQSSSKSGVKIFDASAIHEISLSFDKKDYDAMIATYRLNGEKDWIKASAVIDGTTYRQVGVRLKGNSSIMGLRGGMRGGGPSGTVATDAPEGLPWLIRLNKEIKTQNIHGVVDIVVRSNTSKTALNEAVALDLLEKAGLATQRAISVRFSVNGSAQVLRLATENPDDVWMADNFSSNGALYKAESSGDFSYRGDDPKSYEDVFDQEGGTYLADLTPLIDFLKFINTSDDATFGAQLPQWLDVDAFAKYLAVEELLGNFDDIDGPGNNSYLYYDLTSHTFSIVPWDHNLAFGGFGGGGFGGTAPGVIDEAPGEGLAPAGPAANATGQPPHRVQGGPAGGNVAGAGGLPGNAKGMGQSNILVERFHANPEFQKLYEGRLAELKEQLYSSGVAAELLAVRAAVIKSGAPDLVDSAVVDEEAAEISTFIESR